MTGASITDTDIRRLRELLFQRRPADAVSLHGLVACHDALGRSHRRSSARARCAQLLQTLPQETTLTSMTPMTRQFLYPTGRQFPFDEVCARIVRALEARAFQVPGFVVELRDYGSGQQLLQCVSSIKSNPSAIDLGQHDVKIEFGRPQGRLPGGRWNNAAGVNAVQLPRRSLRVYEDESGPTYSVYVGDDWERDRSTWWTRLNARLHKDPRLCVHYAGAYPRYKGFRPALLAAVRDHREYEPEGAEPVEFDTATIMEEFRAYLTDVVLPAIEAWPVATPVEATPVEAPILMPDGFSTFYMYAEGSDVRRIEAGKKNLDDLAPPYQYGLEGNGRRLAPLGIKKGPDLPEVAYDGFLWCGTTKNFSSEHGWLSADVLIEVRPKDARGIYVADHAVYEKRRAALSAAIRGKRDCFTDEQKVNDFIRARACTIVSILDYKGDYEAPVYLINRELSFDEVEVIGRVNARDGAWRSA